MLRVCFLKERELWETVHLGFLRILGIYWLIPEDTELPPDYIQEW